MSVSSRSPYFSFTSLSIWRPRSMPGPLKECSEVRLALSNEALNMMSVPCLLLISTSLAATMSSSSADSITQGPAINVCLMSMFFNIIPCKDKHFSVNSQLFAGFFALRALFVLDMYVLLRERNLDAVLIQRVVDGAKHVADDVRFLDGVGPHENLEIDARIAQFANN